MAPSALVLDPQLLHVPDRVSPIGTAQPPDAPVDKVGHHAWEEERDRHVRSKDLHELTIDSVPGIQVRDDLHAVNKFDNLGVLVTERRVLAEVLLETIDAQPVG